MLPLLRDSSSLAMPLDSSVPGRDDDGQGHAPDRNGGRAKQPLPAEALKQTRETFNQSQTPSHLGAIITMAAESEITITAAEL